MKNKHRILLDNAYEAWAAAICYHEKLINGRSSLLNKKLFITALYNAVELFLKQIMLDKNDHDIAELRSKAGKKEDNAVLSYYQSSDLNNFFENLDESNFKKFKTINFSKLKIKDGDKTILVDEMKLLGRLRNHQTHFYIRGDVFLTSKEFLVLHNFMVEFYAFLQHNQLITFWEPPYGETIKYVFEKEKLTCFTYANALSEDELGKTILRVLDNSEEYKQIESSFELAQALILKNENLAREPFEDILAVLDAMLKYEILTREVIIAANIWYYKYHVLPQ